MVSPAERAAGGKALRSGTWSTPGTARTTLWSKQREKGKVGGDEV